MNTSDEDKIRQYLEWGDFVRCDTCGELQMEGEGYYPEDYRERLCYGCGDLESKQGIVGTLPEEFPKQQELTDDS